MEPATEARETRRVVYCLIPRDLASKLHEYLRDHWRDEPDVRVVVERRTAERRDRPRRAAADPVPDRTDERRRVRSASGRRVTDRRAATVVSEAPRLPRRARVHAARLVFVERLEPTSQRRLDVEAIRLVIRLQQGDESAMPELYMRYFDSVYRYARVALRDSHEAEDVTQQVFANAFQALPRYEIRPATPFRAWLFRIVRNALIDSIRRTEKISPEPPESVESRRDRSVSHDAEQMLTWLNDADLTIFIQRLPRSQREVLVLRFMLDLTPTEIAEVLDKTPKAVRRLQERALATLEERLVAIGRNPVREQRRVPMWVRLRPVPVLSARRFALASSPGPAALRAAYQRRSG